MAQIENTKPPDPPVSKNTQFFNFSYKCGFYSVKIARGNWPIWKAATLLNKNHNNGSKLTNWVFLESVSPGDFGFSI